MKRNLIVICISVCSLVAQAVTSCGVSNAKIIDVFQYYDGYVFVAFDKQTSCDCPQKSRMAFNVNDPETKFIQSMVLMAYSTGRSVSASTNIEGCPVHDNSPRMNYFRIHPDN